MINFYLTSRFHIVMHLFSNRSQMTLKCGKKKKEVAHEPQMSVSLMFTIAAWNLFVLYNEERRKNDLHILAS